MDAGFLFDKAGVLGDMLKERPSVLSWVLSCSQVQCRPCHEVCFQFQMLHYGLFGQHSRTLHILLILTFV